jgi:Flp pilus assembly protein TadD
VLVFGAALILLIITLFVLGKAKQFPYLPVGWFWFLGTMVPVIGLVQVGIQALADRYTYIPFVGLFVMAAWGAPELVRKWPYKRALMATAAGVILLSFLIVTHAQLKHWQSSLTLFSHALGVTSDNAVAHNNLGIALRGKGRLDEAELHYHDALKIKTYDGHVHFNLGNLLLARGKTDEAIFHFSEALRIKPAYIKAHINIGVALARQNRLPEAADHYKKAIALDADDAGTHFNLGTVLYAMGQPEEAVAQLEEAILIQPRFAEAYNELGRIVGSSGKTNEAIGYFKKALMLKPDFAAARNNLEIALSLQNRQENKSGTGQGGWDTSNNTP